MPKSKLSPVRRWEKNFVNSLKFSATDYARKNLSVPFEIKDSYSDQMKNLQDVIRKSRNESGRIDKMVTASPLFKTIKEGYKNALSDLKTGNLYNNARQDKAMDAKMQKEMGDFDFNFDDFDKELDDGTSEEDTSLDNLNREATATISNDINAGFEASSHSITSAIATGNSLVSDTVRASSLLLYAPIVEGNRINKIGFEALNSTTKSILNFQQNVVAKHIENSTKFYESTTNYLAQQNAMMKEMLDMQRNLYKQQQDKYYSAKEGSFSDVAGSGIPSFEKYKKAIKKNFDDSMVGSLMGLMGMVGSDALTASPLSFLSDAMFSTLLGPKLDRSIKSFNKTAGGVFGAAMNKLNKKADSGFGPLSMLADIFGIRSTEKKTIDPSKFVKGPMAFNGMANMSLVEVMPSYLSRIEAALTGGPTRIFDMRTGKWTTENKVKQAFQHERNSSLNSALSEFIDSVVPNLRKIDYGKNKTSQKQLYNDFASFIQALVPTNGQFNLNFNRGTHRTQSGTHKSFGVSSQQNMDILANIIESLPGATKMQLSGNIRQWKDTRNADLKRIENTPGMIERLLFDNALGGNGKKSVNSRFNSSQQALNATGILNNLYKETHAIRTLLERNYRGGGGGLGVRRGGGSPFTGGGGVHKRHGGAASTSSHPNNTSGLDVLGLSEESLYSDYEATPFDEKTVLASVRKNAKKVNAQTMEYNDSYGGFFDESFQSKYRKLKGKNVVEKVKNADTITDQVTAVTGFMASLRNKPAEFMANLVDGVNNSIYNFFYDQPYEMTDRNGKKVKGFFKVMTTKMTEGFSDVTEYIKSGLIDPLSNYINNLSPDSVAGRTRDKMKSAFSYVKNRVGKAFGRVAGDIRNNSKGDSFVGSISSFFNDKPKGGRASGDRYIKKSGIYALSEGEAVIPSDANPFNPNRNKANRQQDAAREAAILKNAKKYGVDVKGNFAKGTKDADLLGKLLESINEMKDAIIGRSKAMNGKGNTAKETDEKINKTSSEAATQIKKMAPDAFTGAAVGGVGGLLFTGGPIGVLAGAAIGSGISIAKNSELVQEKLFGKKDEKGNRDPYGGLLGKGMLGHIRKYGKTMVDYGIVGSVAGAFTPFGAFGGLVLGSAAGFIKENDTVKKFFFGEDGKKKTVAQKFLSEHMARLTASSGIGALAGGAIAGPFGAVGGMLVGGALSFASTTDKFQNLMLGKVDKKTGKRKGGILGVMREVIIDPLSQRMKSMQDDLNKYMKDELFKPLKKGLAPFGQLMKVGARNMFTKIQDTVTGAMRPSKLKFWASKLMSSTGITGKTLKGGALGYGLAALLGVNPLMALGGAGLGALASHTKAGRWLGRNTVGKIGSMARGVKGAFSKASDYANRRLVESGNAENMSAAERASLMAGRGNYEYGKFDTNLAHAKTEDVKEALGAVQAMRGNKDAMKKSLYSQEDEMQKLLMQSGVNGKHWDQIIGAVKGGDSADNRMALEQAWRTIDESKMDAGSARKLKNSLIGAGAKWSKSNSMLNSKGEMNKYLKKMGVNADNPGALAKYERMLKAEVGFRGEKGKEYLEPENNPNTVTNNNLALMVNYTKATNAYLEAMVTTMNGGKPDLEALRKLNAQNPELGAGSTIKAIENADNVEQNAKDLGRATDAVQIGNRRAADKKASAQVDKLFGGNLSRADKKTIAAAKKNNPQAYKLAVKLKQDGTINDVSAFKEILNMSPEKVSRAKSAAKRGMTLDANTISGLNESNGGQWDMTKKAVKSGLNVTDPTFKGLNGDFGTLNSDIRALQSNGIELSQSDHYKLLDPKAQVARADIMNALSSGDVDTALKLLKRIGINATKGSNRHYGSRLGAAAGALGHGLAKTIDFSYAGTTLPAKALVKGVSLAATGANKLIHIKSEIAKAKNYIQVSRIMKQIAKNRGSEAVSEADIKQAINDNPNLSPEEKAKLDTSGVTGYAFGGKILKRGLAALSAGELVTHAKNFFGFGGKKDDKAKTAEGDGEPKKRSLKSRLWGLTKGALKGIGNFVSPDLMAAGSMAYNAAKSLRGDGGAPSSGGSHPSNETASGLDKTDEKTVSTPYGVQTYKKSTNGTYALDDTKANKEVSDKMAADADIKRQSLAYLQVIAQNTANMGGGEGGPGAQPADMDDDGGILDKLGDMIPGALGALGAISPFLSKLVPGFIKRRYRKVKTGISNKFKSAKGFARNKVIDPIKTKFKAVGNFGRNITNSVKKKASSAVGTVKDVSRDLLSNAKGTASKAPDAIKGKLGEAIGTIKKGLTLIAEKAARYIPKGMASKVGALCEAVLKRVTSPKILAKAAGKATKQMGVLAGGAVAGPLGVGVVTAAVVGYNFYEGWSSASKYFNVKDGDATTSQKLISGFANAAMSSIPVLGWFMDGGDLVAIGKMVMGGDSNSGNGNKTDDDGNGGGDGNKKDQDANSSMLDGALKTIKDFGMSIYESAKSIGSSVLQVGKSGVEWIWKKVSDIGASVEQSAASMYQNITSKIPTGQQIKNGFSNGLQYVKDKAGALWDWTKTKAGNLKNSLFGSGKYGRGALVPQGAFASQLDPNAAPMPFNAPGDTEYQTMADSGCGPGAAANAVAGLGGKLDINSAANYALSKGYKEKDGGTKPGFFSSLFSKMGVNTDNVSNNTAGIMSNLKRGNPVVLMGKDSQVSDNTPYGPGPHYVTATGLDDQGNMIVQDSESDGPNKLYDPSSVISKSNIAIAARPKTRSKAEIKADSNPQGKGGPATPTYGTGIAARRYARMNIKNKFGRGGSMRWRFGRGPGDGVMAAPPGGAPSPVQQPAAGGQQKAGPAIYSSLQGLGFTPIAAAGVMGNMMQESRLFPDIVEDKGNGPTHSPTMVIDGETGYGLCQWTTKERQQNLQNFADANGAQVCDAGIQCAFVVHEMPDLIGALNACQSPTEAADKFHEMFERSDDGTMQIREGFAEQAYANNGDIPNANDGSVSATSVGAGAAGGQPAKPQYSGLYGAFDKMSDTLDSALSSFNFGGGKYGRSRRRVHRFGRGLEEIAADVVNGGAQTDKAAAPDAVTANLAPANAKPPVVKQPAPSADNNPFADITSPFQSSLSGITSKFNSAMAPVKSVMSGLANSRIGKLMTGVFGSNPFAPQQQQAAPGGGSGGSNAGGTSSNPNINAASQYANSRVGSQGYGNNGCTEWANDYLAHANAGQISLNVPLAMSNSQNKGTPAPWKDASQGAVEGDVGIVETNNDFDDGPDHAIIADGQGGYWGNSSSRNEIVHGDIASDWGASNIYGYIGTGGAGNGNVAQGNMSRDSSSAAGDATMDGQGKYGRGKFGLGRGGWVYGRSKEEVKRKLNILDRTLNRSKNKMGKGIFGRSVMNTKKKIDMLNRQRKQRYGRGTADVFSSIDSNNNAADALSSYNNSFTPPAPSSAPSPVAAPVTPSGNSDKVDKIVTLLTSMNGFLSVIAQGIGSLANIQPQAAPAPLVQAAATSSGVTDNFDKGQITSILGDMLKLAGK